MAIDDDTIAKLKAEHLGKELHVLSHPKYPEDGEVVVRVPSEDEWKMYRSMQAEPSTKLTAGATLVKLVIVHPDKAEVQRRIAAHPGIVETWHGEVAEVAGISSGATNRKL